MNNKDFSISSEDIELLKTNYPDADYIPKKDCPGWLNRLGFISKDDIGIQILLSSTGVTLNSLEGSLRLMPEALSVYLAGLTAKARSLKGRFSVGLPPFGRDISLFLACTSVLSKIIERHQRLKVNNRGVLIISTDLRIRSLYCDLFIQKEPLDIAFPGSRLLPNGEIQPLGKSTHKIFSGVCFFLPHRKILPNRISIKPDIILLDLRYGRLNSKVEDLVGWITKLKLPSGILSLYTIGDRVSRAILRKHDFCDFPLDHCGIQTCRSNVKQKIIGLNSSSIDLSLMEAVNALSRQHIVKNISLNPELKSTMSNLAVFFKEHNDNNHIELNRLRWLFAIYSQIPTPMVWYENIARGRGRWLPKNVIKRIGSNTRDIGNLGPVLQTFRAHFKLLDSLYEKSNPKAEELKQLILSLAKKISRDERLLVLVRDETMENALSSWLSLSEFMGEAWLSYIDVIACKKYIQYSNQKYKYFISSGSLHYKYRWILGGNIGQFLYFLTYPHEVDIVKHQIEQFYDRDILNLRADRRRKAIGYSGSDTGKQENLQYPKLNIDIVGAYAPTQPTGKAKSKKQLGSFDDLWESFKVQEELNKQNKEEAVDDFQNICEDTMGEDDIEESTSTLALKEIEQFAYDADGVKCFKLTVYSKLRGKGQIWVNENAYVEYIRPSDSMELFRNGPEQLKNGDLFLIVDENQQSGIFERLIEIADSSPRIQYISVYRNIWRKAINILASKYQTYGAKIDYASMYTALRSAQIKIETYQTLKNWINDIVIGPDDISSIIAVGKTSNVLELVNNARQFDKTFNDIRSLHRTIGRKVASVIRRTFKLVATEDEIEKDDDLQDYLGIPLNEIINAIEIAEILEITPPGKDGISPSLVGKFVTIE
ncbi:MAG: DrmE family protein [Candidatus Omnitrophica bacterium]|nr:DrmE family protein [Candidatus Omnitrophota bacterium]